MANETEINQPQEQDAKLPELPQKLTLFQRLSSKAYEQAMADALSYRANLEEVMRATEATDARLTARESEISRNEYEAQRRIQEKKDELARREAAIAKKEEELAKREAALNERENDIGSKEAAATAQMMAGKKAEKLFREKEGIEPEVKTTSLERDEIIKAALTSIKETAEKLRQLTEMNKVRKVSTEEVMDLELKKANLRAALLATVCVYRDTLPEIDRLAFTINGKSCAVFLKEQADLISYETAGKHIVPQKTEISKEALSVVDSTYIRIAKKMGLDAEKVYQGADYGPFETRLNLTDHRRAGFNVFEMCKSGEMYGLELKGQYAKNPRATTDITKTTALEAEISDVAKTTEEWDR